MESLRSMLLRLLPVIKQPSVNMLTESKEFFRRPLPRHCISFCSPEGKQIFREALLSGHMESYFSLASQLCTQEEPSHCGLATLTMIFNALELDPGRIWKGPWRWYHESMLKCCLPPDVVTNGIVLDKFVQMARCNGLDVDLHRVYPGDTPTKFRELLLDISTGKQPGVLVVSYERSSLGQTGSGHFAPVGGYHPQRELVFLFDTARFKYPPHWVPLARLWAGMRQIDPITQLPRGFMLLKKSAISLSPEQLKELRQELKSQNSSFVFSQTLHAEPMLKFFSISDGVRQAYLSPFSLSDSRTAGFRLRQVADNWIQWLKSDSDLTDQLSTDLVEKALIYFITQIENIRPTCFFFSIRPLTETGNSPNRSNIQHNILRDLTTSPVGRLASKYIATLPAEFVTWLATEGPFRLNSSFTDTSDASLCPLALVSDSRLRITVLLTGFLFSFPYNQIISQFTAISTSSSPTRLLMMTKLLEDMKLLDPTRSELQILENTLWSMIQKGDLFIGGQQCDKHETVSIAS